MRRVAEWIARSAGTLSRRLGRGGGTTLPGVVLLRLRPDAVGEMAAELRRGSVAISATNGKTTTARMIRSAVDAAGWQTVANTAGSNLLRGVAAALLTAPDDADFGLFEVDEAALPAVVEQARPQVLVLMNLFRDQLDRYGELETVVATWRHLVAGLDADTRLVLNADDPAIAFLGEGRPNVTWFGFADSSHARAELAHAADSTHCPRCDTALDYSMVTIGHMGAWSCPSCGLQRPAADVEISRLDLRGLDGVELSLATPAGPLSFDLALPGLHNAYNAAAAVAASLALGIDASLLGDAMASTHAAFGRGEHVDLAHRRLVLLLAKNPSGANENVRTALLDEGPLQLMILLNDRTADGQDVSWIWDVDYEPLFDRAAHITVSGDRAHDMALRLVYGGCPRELLTVEPDVGRALDAMIASTTAGDAVYLFPTYTAMLDVRAELVRRGVAHAFWEDA